MVTTTYISIGPRSVLPFGKEQPDATKEVHTKRVGAKRDIEPLLAQGFSQFFAGRPSIYSFRVRPVFSDFMEFSGNLVDQVEALRGEKDRPLRALAVDFKESNPALTLMRCVQNERVEIHFRYGFAVARQDDTPPAGVDRSSVRWISLKGQLVIIQVGAPSGAVGQGDRAVVDV